MIWLNVSAVSTLHGSLPAADAAAAAIRNSGEMTPTLRRKASFDKRMIKLLNFRRSSLTSYLAESALVWSKLHIPYQRDSRTPPGVRSTLCCGFQWLILCSPNQEPQEYRGLAER